MHNLGAFSGFCDFPKVVLILLLNREGIEPSTYCLRATGIAIWQMFRRIFLRYFVAKFYVKT
jgi:hypothetical protein